PAIRRNAPADRHKNAEYSLVRIETLPHPAGRNKKLSIGLALGGGGARGLAHIGVLKVLENAGIIPQVVAGTSMGSIIGALYCHFQDARLTEEKVIRQLENPQMADLGFGKFQGAKSGTAIKRNLEKTLENLTKVYLLTSVLTKNHIIAEAKVKRMLSLLLPEINIEDLPLSFGCVAADLLGGKSYLFQQGPLLRATQASAAIPGVFPPVEHEGMQLVDGAIVALVPVLETHALGANFTIAVDVSPFMPSTAKFGTGIEIWLRADMIACKTLRDCYLKEADCLIAVTNMNFEWHAFHAAREIIQAGEQAAEAALPSIRSALRARLPWWRRCFAPRLPA
ncbi:patatin-like phospholipase family protein, partial [candidate division FCPU426 bacterium]|nr:patatin-like phospholipase family protein [candidate division FCPU426 bacterium]